MKIILATDGSPYSSAAVDEIIGRPWPEGSEVKVVTVAHAVPLAYDPMLLGAAVHLESSAAEQERSAQVHAAAVAKIRENCPALKVSDFGSEVGSPKDVILDEAEKWGADLILIGSHGYGAVKRFVLGSVSQEVALHAPCSVEIVRPKAKPVRAA